MSIEGILFDFGGTLDSDGGHWLDRTYALYERRRLQVPRLEIKQAFYAADEACDQADTVRHRTLRALMTYHFEYQLHQLGIPSSEDSAWLAGEFCRDAEAAFQRNRPTLEQLSRKYPLGVLSNFYGNLAEILEEAGIARFFKAVLDSSRERLHKPDLEFFKLGCERLRVAPANTAMVGDNLDRDVAPAKELGMKTFWVTGNGKRTATRMGFADHQVAVLGDILSYLG